MSIAKLFRPIVKFITFTDIPIWKKLLMFSSGGIAWFIIISLVGFGAVTYVNNSSKALTDQVIPQIQAGQKAIIKIRGANVSVHNIVIHDNFDTVNENIKRAKGIIDNVSSDLESLLKGGKIRDYSDLNGELIEEFEVIPLEKGTVGERIIKELFVKSKQLRESLDAMAILKLQGIERGHLGQEEQNAFMNMLREYDALTVEAVTVLGKFTSKISELQQYHTKRIKTVLSRAMVIFIFIGILAVSLVVLFSHFLKTSITRPLKAITDQIKGLSEGEVDLTKQIAVGSKDEIAELSTNFNLLMHTIHDMNTFKKVIEEDDTLEDVYVRLARVFNEKLGLDEVLLYEVSKRKRTMQLIETPYSMDNVCCNKEILINSTLCRARKTGHVISSILYPEICTQYLLGPEKYHVCIPMIVGGSIGGVVQFQFDKTRDVDGRNAEPILQRSCIERQILKAEQYTKESSAVIEAKRLTSALKESSVRDQMTGLYNRRFLEEYVDTLIAGVTRKGSRLGLLMCDLDFFKEVNDKHGHDVGDTVLKETARIISRSARSADMVIRFGGEEFLVIVNDAQEGDAGEVAERIRKKVQEAKIKTSGGIIQKTISIGYSQFPIDTQNFWEAIKYADIALYKAKDSGRNKVLPFEREMWTAEAY
jgi:diguanylate cyclase (GGDEF)-like protein